MKIIVESVGFLSGSPLLGGFTKRELELPERTRLARVLESLGIGPNVPLLVTVNGERCERDALLSDGDVVRLVPLIGGG
jgi:sulfur carrier protein ThiS